MDEATEDTSAVYVKQVVARGYDVIADTYATWSLRADDPAKGKFASHAIDSHPDGGLLIDLGCGTGEHVTALLHPHFDVVGVDISRRSVELAQKRVPGPAFLVGDMATVEFAESSVDVVTAFYSMIHVPRTEHGELLQNIARWLRPGGTLVATMGMTAKEAHEPDWLGAPMYWSHFDGETNQRLVRDAGFEISIAEQIFERDEPFSHLWVVASLPL